MKCFLCRALDSVIMLSLLPFRFPSLFPCPCSCCSSCNIIHLSINRVSRCKVGTGEGGASPANLIDTAPIKYEYRDKYIESYSLVQGSLVQVSGRNYIIGCVARCFG
jgi:hypothetical protein